MSSNDEQLDQDVTEDESRLVFQEGTVLQGTYKIVRALAWGGMSEVYLATHERLPGYFAVKALHKDLVREAPAMARFRREGEIMASLRHPNIVQVFDFNVAPDGTPYLVMEYLPGKDLSDHLEQHRRMAPAEAVRAVVQIARALDAAHARGVVHRDLKPENVVLVPLHDGQTLVKVIDFGISKIRRGRRITANATLLGTPQFMAPEQAQGRRDEVDHRTDQFALAVMTYTLLTGRTPFRDGDPASVLYRIVHHAPEPLDRHVEWPTARVQAVLWRALAKRREDRFPSVLEFARALEQAVAGLDQNVASRKPRRRGVSRLWRRNTLDDIRTRDTVELRVERPARSILARVARFLVPAAALATAAAATAMALLATTGH